MYIYMARERETHKQIYNTEYEYKYTYIYIYMNINMYIWVASSSTSSVVVVRPSSSVIRPRRLVVRRPSSVFVSKKENIQST